MAAGERLHTESLYTIPNTRSGRLNVQMKWGFYRRNLLSAIRRKDPGKVYTHAVHLFHLGHKMLDHRHLPTRLELLKMARVRAMHRQLGIGDATGRCVPRHKGKRGWGS